MSKKVSSQIIFSKDFYLKLECNNYYARLAVIRNDATTSM